MLIALPPPAFRDPDVRPHGKVLEMVMIDAAKALSIDHEVGSLEAGKLADIMLVDLFRPHVMPMNMPVYRMTCFANAADVCMTMVGGRVLMEDRRVLSVDEQAVLEQVTEVAEATFARSGLRHLLDEPAALWGRSHY
ncbi:hypothetical protein WT15_32905 [Burkholderia stagnalis]|nr:hypothetical protein WT74_22220 [Burkholderia stagnalis]KVN68564.1 hypothetical protein WT15_32905 [Burkholderia stagnalis]KVX65953.1 hypothetical protein WT33_09030 [Burkholderia stagnalis]KWI34219.1 hypothetical protein WT71_07180 [Burkholderia stagnalis]KWI66545.1 hypothetical protein WT73_18200 [Burkholderia stagnalis]